jgi:hypothetical protein
VGRLNTIVCLNLFKEKGELPRRPVPFASAARGQEGKEHENKK